MRTILHSDLNSFYASVEMLHHPELRNVPMAVGGDPEDPELNQRIREYLNEFELHGIDNITLEI